MKMHQKDFPSLCALGLMETRLNQEVYKTLLFVVFCSGTWTRLQANESDVMAVLEKKVVTPPPCEGESLYTTKIYICIYFKRRYGNKCENELVMTLRAVNIKDTKLNKILEHYCQNGRVQGIENSINIYIVEMYIPN